MAGRGVKHSRQCCKYGWGGRHACARAIICLCLCPPRHLATFVWPSLVLACAHLGVVFAQCLSPLPGCICLTSARSHLCSFGVICARSASICTRLCLSSLSLVPVSNIWLVHTWWTDSPLYHKLFTCIRTIDLFLIHNTITYIILEVDESGSERLMVRGKDILVLPCYRLYNRCF